MPNKVSTMTGVSHAKAATRAPPPVEVGMTGTLGSLVKKEMEYYKGIGLGQYGQSSAKSNKHFAESKHFLDNNNFEEDKSLGGGNTWPGSGFLKNKKKTNGYLPSVCCHVEVADTHQPNKVSGLRYENLKADD